MALSEYLGKFTRSRRVILVGPLYQGPEIRTEPVIFIDGGSNYREGKIGFAVGDGDSSDNRLDHYLDTDKSYSDLAYVLARLPSGFTELTLLGFLGARRDHELFNLGEVHHFLSGLSNRGKVQFDDDITAFSKGEWSFEVNDTFSLAVIEPTRLSLTGKCKYPIPLETELLPLSSRGLSNQGFGSVTLNTAGPVFIFSPTYNSD